VLGGGITRIWRPAIPAPLAVSFAALIDFPPAGHDVPHEIHLVIRSDEGEPVSEVMAGMQIPRSPRLETGEHTLVPLVVPLQQIGVPRYGRYDFQASVDQGAPVVLQCWVLHPDEQMLPPLPLDPDS
jgi:hypothetical protein